MINQIDSIQAKHPKEVDSLQGYNLTGWQGVQLPMLRSSTYQTILNSGISKDIPIKILKDIAFIYNIQSVIERGDNSIIEKFISDNNFTRLAKIKHLFILYSEILPDIITSYQVLGKKHLKNYGYKTEVKDKRLSELVEVRGKNYIGY